MPIISEHQRARRHKLKVSRHGCIDPEEEYVIEAGDSDGIKYRWAIQYGYDFEFQTNRDAAKKEWDRIFVGYPVPAWRGSFKRGRFSKRSMFYPTWAKLYRGEVVIDEWTKPAAEEFS